MPPLVMLNVPPVRSSSFSAPSRAARPKSAIAASMPGEAELVGVADHRHHQPRWAADRDAHVDEVLVDDVVAVDLGIDRRELLQRRRSRRARRRP